MIYARAHDQTVADDYFTAMQRVEERLALDDDLETSVEPKENMGDVKVQEKVFQLIEKLEMPELCFEERLLLAGQLRLALGIVHEHAPPV